VNRLVAAGALAAFLVAMLVIVIASATSGGGSSSKPTTTAPPTATPPTTTSPPPPKRVAVRLDGRGVFDPEGDGHENEDLAPLAVDGNERTFWRTEHYKRFFKKGVGLVLDAGRSLGLSRVVVKTDTRGSSAQIRLGNSPAGPFHAVSAARPLTGTTTYTLNKGAAGRFVVIWITALPQDLREAHITEVQATRLVTG
jgi:putative peptidoglycan lipid II flippase